MTTVDENKAHYNLILKWRVSKNTQMNDANYAEIVKFIFKK